MSRTLRVTARAHDSSLHVDILAHHQKHLIIMMMVMMMMMSVTITMTMMALLMILMIAAVGSDDVSSDAVCQRRSSSRQHDFTAQVQPRLPTVLYHP